MGRELADDIVSDSIEFCNTRDFGRELLYVPIRGAARTITAMAHVRKGALDRGQAHESQQTMLYVFAPRSATDGLIASGPNAVGPGDAIIMDGETYGFLELLGDNGATVGATFGKRDLTNSGKAPSQL